MHLLKVNKLRKFNDNHFNSSNAVKDSLLGSLSSHWLEKIYWMSTKCDFFSFESLLYIYCLHMLYIKFIYVYLKHHNLTRTTAHIGQSLACLASNQHHSSLSLAYFNSKKNIDLNVE